MLFNENNINLSNYQEWLVLYVDNELPAGKMQLVDDFLLHHPHLQEELDLLLSTKLPVENFVFSAKDNLMAAAMKLNVVDESLLLYIDNELSPAGKQQVEAKLAVDETMRWQYQQLQKAKFDAAEQVLYPNKNELYRHAAGRVAFRLWIRVAAAVILLLAGGYLFQQHTSNDSGNPAPVAVNHHPVSTLPPSAPVPAEKDTQPAEAITSATEPSLVAKIVQPIKSNQPVSQPVTVSIEKGKADGRLTNEKQMAQAAAIRHREAVQIEVKKLVAQPIGAVNNSVANLAVTSIVAPAYNETEDPEEPAVNPGNDHSNYRTPAKGFFRKVSRFIERRTGIGTVNADNELLVGAVALKLN